MSERQNAITLKSLESISQNEICALVILLSKDTFHFNNSSLRTLL